MPDYTKGKIYKLQCEDGYYYIGSTRNELRIRLQDHKNDARKNPTRKVYAHINTIGWTAVRIVLVKEVCCETRDQLRQYEDEHIKLARDDPFCLNVVRACLTETEKVEYFKPGDTSMLRRDFEAKRQYDRSYYEANADTIKKNIYRWKHSLFTCSCGVTITNQSRRYHFKSKRHLTPS